MFYGKRSPFCVKVKTKRIKLYIIKKDDYSNICDNYKNVIKRINKKKKKKFKIIKNMLIKTIDKFCYSNGIKIKEEYRSEIEEAIKEININMTPDILKNTSIANTFGNEIDEEINKSINEFKVNVIKVSTIKPLIKQKTKKRTINSLMKGNATPKNVISPKPSFNFLSRGSIGANIIQGFKHTYYDNFNQSKRSSFINTDEINNLLFKKIVDKKKLLSQQIQDKTNKEYKTEIAPIDEKEKNLKDIIFHNSDSGEESNKTVKLKNNGSDILDHGPTTIDALPLSLQNLILNKFKIRKI